MRTYLEFAKKSFQNNVAYRAEYYAGFVNTIVMIFVNLAIWRAIYEEDEVLGGVEFSMVATYIILAFLIQNIFMMDEYFIAGKVQSGMITSDILKPVNFQLYIFSYNLGALAFKIIMQLLPCLLVVHWMFSILPPFSFEMSLWFGLSLFLAYLVIYSLNFIVWLCSFWLYHIFSLITIKESMIMVLSGALFPLWFMPKWVVDLIELTPFDAIFFIPISIYLGQVPVDELASTLLRQVMWVGILAVTGTIVWKFAERKLTVQGG